MLPKQGWAKKAHPCFGKCLILKQLRFAQFNLFALVYCQFHRTVVRSENLGVNLGVNQSVSEILRSDEIVNTPAYILLTSLEAV